MSGILTTCAAGFKSSGPIGPNLVPIQQGEKKPDAIDPARLRRLEHERRGEEAARQHRNERSAIHHSDHLIRPQEERLRDREAEGPSRS